MNDKKIKFTIRDSLNFSKLSGDYNPVHIDSLMSRRYMFGEPIVHGMHLVFWSLDNWFSNKKNNYFKINSLDVNFPKAVTLEKDVYWKHTEQSSQLSIIELIQNGILCAKIKINFEISKDSNPSLSVIEEFPPKTVPEDLSFKELKNKKGTTKQYLEISCFTKSFNHVFRNLDKFQIASLLSTTRVIGMYCPGLNSLISQMNISFIKNDCYDNDLKYEVVKADDRFNMLFIKLTSINFNVDLKTFMRPSPVDQLSYKDVVSNINSKEFKDQRVLVVGGSRGLGEIATKILVAGGASVRFTYNKGEKDALKIEEELLMHNDSVSKMKLDVCSTDDYESIISDDWVPTHCYYFATPFIFSGVKGKFSESLLNQFNSVYVTGFINLVNFLRDLGTLKYFYPSTVAINEMPQNMVEYTISKYSAQKACQILTEIDHRLKIDLFEFPRMQTDQTVSFLPVKNHDPFKYTLSFIR